MSKTKWTVAGATLGAACVACLVGGFGIAADGSLKHTLGWLLALAPFGALLGGAFAFGEVEEAAKKREGVR